MILMESLRVYPPVWVIPRDALKDDEIGGYRIPAGATILLSPCLTHRHRRLRGSMSRMHPGSSRWPDTRVQATLHRQHPVSSPTSVLQT